MIGEWFNYRERSYSFSLLLDFMQKQYRRFSISFDEEKMLVYGLVTFEFVSQDRLADIYREKYGYRAHELTVTLFGESFLIPNIRSFLRALEKDGLIEMYIKEHRAPVMLVGPELSRRYELFYKRTLSDGERDSQVQHLERCLASGTSSALRRKVRR
jgi:hypothetical protein